MEYVSVSITTPNFATALFAQGDLPQSQEGPWHMMHDWGGGWAMILGPLYLIAWLAIFVGIIMLLIRWMGSGGRSPTSNRNTARTILDERFARGEIDDEEYERRRRALES
ncbi:MAG: SHOCT domain-containing protein [Hyphomicrobium sp.]